MRSENITGRWVLGFFAMVLVLQAPQFAGASQTYFSFTSTPNSWVGHGFPSYFVTPEMGWNFSAYSGTDRDHVWLIASGYEPRIITNYNTAWEIHLDAPSRGPLLPGHYSDATRWPFNPYEETGMSLQVTSRGNNTLSGYFTILEFEMNPNGTVSRFAVDFRVYEGMYSKDNWVDGRFRYNSLIPEPASCICLVMFLCIGISRRIVVRF